MDVLEKDQILAQLFTDTVSSFLRSFDRKKNVVLINIHFPSNKQFNYVPTLYETLSTKYLNFKKCFINRD